MASRIQNQYDGPFFKEKAADVKRSVRRLRPISQARAKWQRLYIKVLKAVLGVHPLCVRCLMRLATDGHHYAGRIGAHILLFWPFCRECNTWVHDNPKKAREDGWLQ